MLTIGEFAVFALTMIAMYPVFKVDGWADNNLEPNWALSLIVIASTVGLIIAFFHKRREK
jgi:hypothetical protein